MATCLIVASIVFGTKAGIVGQVATFSGKRGVTAGAMVSFGLIAMIFVGFKFGYATATEITPFAAIYAIMAGLAVFHGLPLRVLARCLA